MFCQRTFDNLINHIHERALRTAYNDYDSESDLRGDRGTVSEGMLMDQTIRENMSKNRPNIPGKCRQCNQYDRVK